MKAALILGALLIPVREAFRWLRFVEGPDAALWYRGPGPWWTDRYARDDDGISVEEQQHDPASLLVVNFSAAPATVHIPSTVVRGLRNDGIPWDLLAVRRDAVRMGKHD